MVLRLQKSSFQVNLRAVLAAFAFVLTLVVLTMPTAEAQTLTVIHNFTGGPDGWYPYAGLTMDSAGNLYGAAAAGGYEGGGCAPAGCGTVFKLTRSGAAWILTTLYSFTGGSNGQEPEARVVFGPDGRLYGTTVGGGFGSGIVFSLVPQVGVCRNALCTWSETVLHRFTGGNDGGFPVGDLIFDQAGDVYGATNNGGSENRGVVYELTPSGGGWAEKVLHNFSHLSDGSYSGSGVIFDNAGNLYGTTEFGGSDFGTVYKLTPAAGGWAERVLYTFSGGSDGYYPVGGLIFDESGALYGTTQGPQGCCGGGTVFRLTPLGEQWTLTTIHTFPQGFGWPFAGLTSDATGNLYGTTSYNDGGGSAGNVFELTREVDGGWSYTSLHEFTGASDGGGPFGGVALDTNGNLYGTASGGGAYSNCDAGCGLAWEITP